MTIDSEFKLVALVRTKSGAGSVDLYRCNACFCVVTRADRNDHRRKMHPKVPTISGDELIRGLPEIPVNEIHEFKPWGSDLVGSRCVVGWCREIEDHPNHAKELHLE